MDNLNMVTMQNAAPRFASVRHATPPGYTLADPEQRAHIRAKFHAKHPLRSDLFDKSVTVYCKKRDDCNSLTWKFMLGDFVATTFPRLLDAMDDFEKTRSVAFPPQQAADDSDSDSDEHLNPDVLFKAAVSEARYKVQTAIWAKNELHRHHVKKLKEVDEGLAEQDREVERLERVIAELKENRKLYVVEAEKHRQKLVTNEKKLMRLHEANKLDSTALLDHPSVRKLMFAGVFSLLKRKRIDDDMDEID